MSDTSRTKPLVPLLVIAALGIALRVVMVLVVHPTCEFDVEWFESPATVAPYVEASKLDQSCYFVRGDSLGIYLQGTVLAREGTFSNPELGIGQEEFLPGAGKPPMMTTAIAGLQLLGLESPTWVRLFSCLLGGASVFVIGLACRKVAGQRAALIGAGIAAAYPMLWINDWRMLNESYLIPFIALTILAAYAFYERPRPRTAALLGAAIAGATLARSESLLLLVFLVAPLAWSLRRFRPGTRAKLGLASAATCIALILPWNLFVLTQFNNASLFATGSGPVLLNGSCDSTFYGELLGYLDFKCIDFQAIAISNLGLNDAGQVADDSDSDRLLRERAMEYISANKARLPVVAAARVGRLWDVYRPAQNVELNTVLEERGRVDSWLALLSYYALVPAAIYGLVVLWRRNLPISPLVGNAIVVTLTAVGSFGLTRYRVSADVALVVAAAVGVDALLRRRATAKAGDATEGLEEPDGRTDPTTDERVPVEAGAWLAAVRSPRRTPPSPRQRKELALGGGVVLAVAALFVVWSAGVQAPEAEAGPTRNPDLLELCAYAKERGMLDPSFLGTLEGSGIDSAISYFEYARTVAPEEILPQVEAVLVTLRDMQSVGSANAWWASRSAEQRTAAFAPVITLLDYADKNCPP